MHTRDFRLAAVTRFVAVERYNQSHQPDTDPTPYRVPARTGRAATSTRTGETAFRRRLGRSTGWGEMSSVAASRLVPHRWPASRYKDLLLGRRWPPRAAAAFAHPCQDMSFQPAGMRAGALTCDPDAMLRCLLVDDSPLFLDAARGLLERQGITVVAVASTSADALRRAVELRPDVTLVDLDLGGESGLELVRRLHRLDGLGPVPVILISTHAEQDYAELIAASPAVGFLPKTALSGDAIRELLAGRSF